jgi:hypothetical protein
MRRVTGIVAGIVLAAVAAPPARVEAQAPPASPPPDCSGPEHREFDFWLGTWDVTAQGKPAGTNAITADLKGCVLVEQWTASSGGRGTSLNYYDRRTRSWHQAWIDDRGGSLRLEGGLRDGRMVMQTRPSPDAKADAAVHRITWSPESGGSVRQVWETSKDGGKTWSTLFDGTYVKTR